MSSRVLSIEIGKEITKVVEMDFRSSRAKIYQNFTMDTPMDMVSDGSVQKSSLFISQFRDELSQRKIRTRKAVFVVSSSRITSRDVTVPQVKDKWLPGVVDSSASDFFPGDMSQYHLVYKTLGTAEEEGEKRLQLNVLAVPNDLTASYFDLSSGLNLDLVALDYVGNSVLQTVGRAVGNTGTHAILKIEEESTLVTIVKEGKQVFQRNLNFGVDECIAAVKRNAVFGHNLSTREAVKLLCGKTVIRRFLNVDTAYSEKEDISSSVKAARIDVTEGLRYLISNVGRVLEYYTARNGNIPIDAIEITGLGADFSGLSKLFSNELNQRVRVFLPGQTASFLKSVDRNDLNAYAACIGAGIAPLNLIREKSGKAGTKAAGKRGTGNGDAMLAAGIVVCLAGVLAGGLLVFLSGMQIETIKNEIKKAQDHISAMSAEGVQEAYDAYSKANDIHTQIQAIYDDTRSRSEEMVAFIEELEEKLPSGLVVLSFTASPTGVTMSVQCDSKETAAKTLMQLREFESIDVVSSSGLTDSSAGMVLGEGEEAEEYPVAFTVDCVYTPLADAGEEL